MLGRVHRCGVLLFAWLSFPLQGCVGPEAPAPELAGEAAPVPAAAASPSGWPVGAIRGRVVRVFDGDSFLFDRRSGRLEVRVFGIDAPEKEQPWAGRARSRARTLLEGREVLLDVQTERDRYGRTIADVYLVDGRNYAHVLVGEGLAWHYRRYSYEAEVAALMEEARRAGRGLWQQRDPEPPWEFRRRNRSRR